MLITCNLMKQKECPSCALMVDKDEKVCHYCGYEFPKQSNTFKIIIVVMLIAFILWVIGIF
jgi:RNA polymerase subunit RPABC4/transcription elongation factor Spt4